MRDEVFHGHKTISYQHSACIDQARLVTAPRAGNYVVRGRVITQKGTSSSGLAAEGGVARAWAAGNNYFISKPYTADTTLRTLAEALKDEG